MKQNNFRTLTACVAVALVASVSWSDEWTDPDTGYTWTYRVNGDTVEIYGSNWSCAISPNPIGTLSIPPKLNDKIVTSIGDYAFLGCDGLTSVTIPDSVTSIGWYAFSGCSGLMRVTIPDTMTSIGESAFSGCSGLTSMTIPDSVTSIGWYAFSGCSSLTSFAVANGNSNYSSANGLLLSKDGRTLIFGVNGDVTISDSVVSIDDFAFQGCSGLTSVTIPDSVTSIGKGVFEGCSGLRSIMIGSGLKVIGMKEATWWMEIEGVTDTTFDGCHSLTSVHITDLAKWCGITIYHPTSNPLLYAHNLYLNGEKVTALTIPNSVTRIGDFAFSGCSGLTSVTIPDSVTSIGEGAFRDCSGLMSVTIPDSVKSVGRGAFEECNEALFDTVTIPGVMLVDGWVVGYTSALSGFLDLTGVRGISDYAFYDCDDLVAVRIPGSVKSIGHGAFFQCLSLMVVKMVGDCPSIPGERDGNWEAGAFVNHWCNPIFGHCWDSPSIFCRVWLPGGNNTYTVIDGAWQGMAVYYYNDTNFSKAQTVDGALYQDGELAGTMQIKVGKVSKKGVVKVSATATLLVEGKAKKVTAKAVNVNVDELTMGLGSHVKIAFKAPIGEMEFEMAADGNFTLENDSYQMEAAKIGGALNGGEYGTFRMDGFDLAVPGELQDGLLPFEEVFSVTGKWWKFAKAATVKWAKDRVTKEYGLVVDDTKGKTNLSGLKLTYAAKTGQFKGSFKAYALQGGGSSGTARPTKPKLVKYTVNVIGFVVDGVGYGEASCKRPVGGPWPVVVE